MIEITEKNGRTYARLDQLKGWDKNPRGIKDWQKRAIAGMANYHKRNSVAGLRQCCRCKKQKEDQLFAVKAKYKNSGLCRDCKNLADRNYHARPDKKQMAKEYWQKKYKEDHDRYRAINSKAVARKRFGIESRSILIKEDSECAVCVITQLEHIEKYNCSLHIHHKDGQGRQALREGRQPNNDLNNLELLCQSCHTIEENKNHQNYTGRGYKAWETRRKNREQCQE